MRRGEPWARAEPANRSNAEAVSVLSPIIIVPSADVTLRVWSGLWTASRGLALLLYQLPRQAGPPLAGGQCFSPAGEPSPKEDNHEAALVVSHALPFHYSRCRGRMRFDPAQRNRVHRRSLDVG